MQNVPKIVRERLRSATSAVNHPDADVLTAFAERSLPELERATVLEHLARCGDCRDIVALALPATEPVGIAGRPSPSPSPSGWLAWPTLRWGFVAAGVVAIASFGIRQYQRSAQRETTASKRAAQVEVAANEPKKQTLDRFVNAAPQEKGKLQSPAAPAFADSVDGGSAAFDEKKKTAVRAEASPSRVLAPSPEGGNSFRDGVVVGAMPHGPRQANQWPVQNNAQNQAPMPAPPSAYSKQERVAGDPRANGRAPAASETVEVSSAAPMITTQNAEVAQVRDQPAVQPSAAGGDASTRVDKAKALVPPASRPEVNNGQPSQDLAGGGLKMRGSAGLMAGYVVDSSGAVVPNARITITPSSAGANATAVTDSQGAWRIVGLPTGNYKAQAEAPGFKTTVLAVNYNANLPTMYGLTLSPGTVSETVEVSAQDAQVQTQGMSIGGPITSRQISQIPVNGRNVTQLSALSAGPMPRWSISAAGVLQRSFDKGNTWQAVDVNANPAPLSRGTSLEIVAKTSRAKAGKEAANEKDADRARKQDAAPLTFRAVAAAGSDVWAGGSAGALYHSQDAGNHWIRVVPASAGASLTGDIISLEFPDPEHGTLSTSTSEIWVTTDAGQTWQKQ